MKHLLIVLLILFASFGIVSGQEGKFRQSQIGSNNLFNGAWEIIWGPDNYLWVSDRITKEISRVNPESGEKDILYQFSEAIQDESQNGLLGFALHNELGSSTGNDFVYASYTYADGDKKKQKIVRLTYSFTEGDGSLIDETDVLVGLPSSNDHNSGRLIFGPDDRLYYTIGDQGANRSRNACNPVLSQVLPSESEIENSDFTHYPGKTLRINLDGTIPEGNPVLDGVKSHIYTYGHRNAQGLVFGPNNRLYSNEHGDNTDDEINLLEIGKNYGWPHVAGYQDNKAYQYCNYSSIENCDSDMWDNYNCNELATSTAESDWSNPDFTEPIATMFTVDNDYNFFDPSCSSSWICRPNVAPSSLDFYGSYNNGIPGWENSLIVVSLKRGRIYRYNLSEDGETLDQNYEEHWNTVNRYRDIAIHPSGNVFYIITDARGGTEAKDGFNRTSNLENPGALLKIEYVSEEELDSDNSLASLSVTQGDLSPAFNPEVLNYTIEVPNGTNSLNIIATPASELASVEIGAFNNIPGSDTITVIAENGTVRKYSIDIDVKLDDNNTLSLLSVAEGALNPPFNPEILSYDVLVPFETTELSITAVASSNKAIVTIGAFDQIPGSDKVIVEAEDNSIKEYTIAIEKEAPLSINELDENRIVFYPNPTSNYLIIEAHSAYSNLKIQLTDLTGRILNVNSMIQNKTNYLIDLTELKVGMYILLYEIEGRQHKKIIIKK